MIVLEFEVVSPETVEVAGHQYNVAGVKVGKKYFVTQVLVEGSVDAEKTANCKEKLDDIYAKFGLPPIEDIENPTLGFKGKIVWALVNSEMAEKRKSPTAEQLAKGIKEGDVLKNPITGKPLIQYFPFVEEIFGLAEQSAGGPL